MRKIQMQWNWIGIFSGATIAVAFIYSYTKLETTPPPQSAPIVSAQEEKPVAKEVTFKKLESGSDAPGAKNRKNYAVYNQDDLNDFWKIAHEDKSAKAPTVDFTKKYVIVAFAGAKPTTGYSIGIEKVEDTGDARSVSVIITEPTADCTTENKKTSPYVFITVPYGTENSISHTDQTVQGCK